MYCEIIHFLVLKDCDVFCHCPLLCTGYWLQCTEFLLSTTLRYSKNCKVEIMHLIVKIVLQKILQICAVISVPCWKPTSPFIFHSYYTHIPHTFQKSSFRHWHILVKQYYYQQTRFCSEILLKSYLTTEPLTLYLNISMMRWDLACFATQKKFVSTPCTVSCLTMWIFHLLLIVGVGCLSQGKEGQKRSI